MQKQNILQSAQQKKKLIYQKDLEDGNVLANFFRFPNVGLIQWIF